MAGTIDPNKDYVALLSSDLGPGWSTFVAAKQTAEEQNVKLYKKANRSRVRDMEAWRNGKRDSRKIDIRRRRLE